MWENILKILQRYGDVYLEGLAGTLWIAALTVVAGTVIGIILAVFRLGKCRPCEWFVRFYIWIIRGTPSLLQLYFFYLFLPKVLPIEISETESVARLSGQASRQWTPVRPKPPAVWDSPGHRPCGSSFSPRR